MRDVQTSSNFKVCYLQKRKKPVDFDKLMTLTEIQHTSMNLGLIVLSDNVELKIKAICLNAECPYVFEPSSTFKFFCSVLILIAIILQSAILPYLISFKRRIPLEFKPILFLLDCLYLFDIYLQLSTAIKGRIYTINTIGAIILYKFKQVVFLIDVIAILPLDYIADAMTASEHMVALLKINRLLKFHTVITFTKSNKNDYRSCSLKTKLQKYIMLYTCTSNSLENYGLRFYVKRKPF